MATRQVADPESALTAAAAPAAALPTAELPTAALPTAALPTAALPTAALPTAALPTAWRFAGFGLETAGIAPTLGPHGGDLVSTWVAKPEVHAEVQITSLNNLQT